MSFRQQGIQFLQQGRVNEASQCFVQALQQNPYDAVTMNLLGIATARQGNYPAGLELMEKALSLNPNIAEIHHNIGPMLRVMGRFDEAETHYRQAIALKPDYAEAYFNLAATRKFESDDPVIEPLTALLKREDLSQLNKCFAHFAAGKIFNDCKEYDLAFEHYRQGNDARELKFDAEHHDKVVDAIIENFPESRFRQWKGYGIDSEAPVFVVGMPRSGTTLAEQIMASHPDCHGAGELSDMTGIMVAIAKHHPQNRGYPHYIADLPANIPAGFANSYLQRLMSLQPGQQRYVDKMPQNFLFLGMIAIMFPNARIVHCVRNPVDTCLSCYFQRFRTSQEYSYRLENLAAYYRSYRRLMAHWKEVLPIRVMDLVYEDVVAEPDATSRKLLEHIGLPWDDRCLTFHETERPVTTASNHQVRQPVYKTSVERWRRYEKHLGPLLDALGLEPDGTESATSQG